MSQPFQPSFENPDQSAEVVADLKSDTQRSVWDELRERQRARGEAAYREQFTKAQKRAAEPPESGGPLDAIFGGLARGAFETARTALVDIPQAAAEASGNRTAQFLAAGAQGVADTVSESIDSVFPRPDGVLLGLVHGVSQFVTGAKIFKLLGVGRFVAGTTLGATGALGTTIRGATQGAIVDFAAFDPEDNIIASAAANLPVVGQLFEQLKADPDDTEVTKRLKSMLTGMGIGIGMEHLLAAFKAVRVRGRFRRMVEEGTLRIEDFDPNGLDLAKRVAITRAAYHDAKKVVGAAPQVVRMLEEGRLGTFEGTETASGKARVRVSQDATSGRSILNGTDDGVGDTVVHEFPNDHKVGGMTDRQRAAVEAAKAEREHLRALRDDLQAAWEEYERSDAFRRQRPDVQRALVQLARNENPRVELVPNDELVSEAGRRAVSRSTSRMPTLQEFVQGPLRENLKKWAFDGTLEQNAGSGRLNLHLMGGPEETKVLFNAIRDAIIASGKGDAIQATSESFEVTAAKTSALLGLDNAEVLQLGAKLAKDTENAAATVQAMRVMLKGYGDELLSAAVDYDAALRSGFVPPEIEARAIALYENAMSAYLTTKGATGNIARALSYMRAGAGEFRKSIDPEDLARAKRTVFGGNIGFAKVMKGIVANGGDLAATYKWLEKIERIRANKALTWARAMHELFVSNTLGAVATHSVNHTGNAGWHIWDVMERDILATTIKRRSLSDAVKSTAAGYAALFDGLLYVTKVAAASFKGQDAAWNIKGNANARAVGRALGNIRRAWQTGESQLLSDGSSIGEIGSYWNSDYLLGEQASALGKGVVDGIGKWVGLVRSSLATGDELWANLNYFVELRRRAYLRGLDQGLSNGALKKYVAEFEEKISDHEMVEIQKKALDLARRNVFQEESDLANFLSSARYNHPVVGLIIDYGIPFKRTPINLFARGLDRVAPLGLGHQVLKGIFDADSTARALATNFKAASATEEGAEWLARYILATGIFASMAFAYYNGRYQGSALSDKERDQIRAQGGMEHSIITFGDGGEKEYHQILRLDPIAIPLGAAADLFKIADHVTEEDDLSEWQALGLSLIMALQNAFRSRNYLGGLTMALDVFNAPSESFAQRSAYWAGQMLGSQFIPNFVPHVNAQILDDQTRVDTRVYTPNGRIDAVASAIQQFKARLGFDSQIPPSRTIFGEVKLPRGFVSPVKSSGPGKLTPAADEFRRLDLPVDLTEWMKDVNGVVLKPGDRLKLGEDFENTRIGGKTVVETLDAIVQSPGYARLPDEQKAKRLTRTVERFKTNAEREFARRPGMAELIRAANVYKKVKNARGEDAAKADSRVQRLLDYYR